MRAIRLSFLHMLKFIRHDMMLFAVLPAPVLVGMVIKFVVPFIPKMLIQFLGTTAVLSPYYGLFDIFFASIVPAMYCFVAAMIILEEHDDHIDRYLYVTGVGRNGYLVSRIVIPAIFAFVVTAALLPVFGLTALSGAEIFFLSLAGTLQGIIIALLIVTVSSNKLEGMAVTKLSSLVMLGAVVPYFVPGTFGFCLSFLPSFWMGKAILENNLVDMLPSCLVAGGWILILQRKFNRKL